MDELIPAGSKEIKTPKGELTPEAWHYIRKALHFAIEAAESSQGDPIRGRIWADRYRKILEAISDK